MSKSRGSGDPPCPFLGAPMMMLCGHGEYVCSVRWLCVHVSYLKPALSVMLRCRDRLTDDVIFRLHEPVDHFVLIRLLARGFLSVA